MTTIRFAHRRRFPGAPALLLLFVLGALFLQQESREPAQRHIALALLQPSVDASLAPTPPMGYDDWNAFHCHVNERLIEQTARAMVTSGMRAAGYRYVIIDDCWSARSRDEHGKLQADHRKFPDGIHAIARYIHSLGLKLGIYTSGGTETCAGYPGSFDHEAQDAATFASWDIDYLKEDWCHVPYDRFQAYTHEQVARFLYATMSRALQATGRPIVLSLSPPNDATIRMWSWGKTVGNLWRTTGDIADSWQSVLTILDRNVAYGANAGPGHWNDPDMLEVGNGSMTAAEDRAHFSLWSIMAAPLIAGTDLRTMSPTTRAILTNREVIAVDQDPLGAQGKVVLRSGNAEVLMKPLLKGGRAVVFLNRGAPGVRITISAHRLGLPRARQYMVRDLWTHITRLSTAVISAFVPARSVVMMRVKTARKIAQSH